MKTYEVKYEITIEVEAEDERKAELFARKVLYYNPDISEDAFIGFKLLQIEEI